jgi:hypothetical protein
MAGRHAPAPSRATPSGAEAFACLLALTLLSGRANSYRPDWRAASSTAAWPTMKPRPNWLVSSREARCLRIQAINLAAAAIIFPLPHSFVGATNNVFRCCSSRIGIVNPNDAFRNIVFARAAWR